MGEEQLTVFAVEGNLPPAFALVAQTETNAKLAKRFVHALYEIDEDGKTIRTLLDPARIAKKTVTFETVPKESDK